MAKAPSLNEFISTPAILHELGSPVKSLPTVINHPDDDAHKLYLYPDDDGIWGVCEELDFYGDTVEIMKHHFGVRSLEQVLWKLEETGCINDRREITDKVITSYEIARTKRRNSLKFWSKCQNQMHELDCDPNILKEIGAFPDDSWQWWEGFGRFLGSAKKDELEKTLGKSLGIKAKDVVILPYFDLPQRLCMLKVLYIQHGELCCLDKPLIGRECGGLFMSETVPYGTDIAIALDDPLLQLDIQYRRMRISSKPFPLIGYNKDTKYWPIWSTRLVFWGLEPTADMFKQARKNPQSAISTPQKAVDYLKLIDENVQGWFQCVMADAKPWMTALKEHLINIEQEYAEALLDQLQLTSEERGMLLYECDHDEKKVLQGLLSTEGIQKYVMIGDQKFIERENCWYATTPKGRLQRISNAIFTIDKSADFGSLGMYLIGTLSFENDTQIFRAPLNDFKKNPVAWLTKFMLDRGMGILQTIKAWNGRLLDVAYAFSASKIEHIVCSSKIGWSEDKTRFRFPTLTLYNGLIDDGDIGIPHGEGMPCLNVTEKTVAATYLQKLLAINNANRYFWAIFAMAVYNTCAVYFGLSKKKFGTIGNNKFVDIVSSALGLSTVQPVVSSHGLRKTLRAIQCHDIPYFIRPESHFNMLAEWLEDIVDKNVIVGLTTAQAFTLGNKKWSFLPVKDVEDDISYMTEFDNLIPVLIKGVQRSTVETVEDPIKFALGIMKDWISGKIKDADLTIIDEAALLLRHHTPLGRISEGEKFVSTLVSLMKEGKIKVGRTGYTKAFHEISIGDTVITVSRSVFSHLPVSSQDTTIKALEKEGLLDDSDISCLKIPRGKWDSICSTWNAANLP